jgi:hypothetical protein
MRKKLLIILIIAPLIGASLFESKLEKAFNALKIYNYFEAKHLFNKSLKKHECAASFGLSEIFLNDLNPFHNIDSARVYALRSQGSWTGTKLKEKEKIDLLNVDSLSILHLTDTVAFTAYNYFADQNTLQGYAYFLDKYAWSDYIESTILLRNKLAFQLAKSENTAKSYDHFIETYPDALQVEEAEVLYELRKFEESTAVKSLEEYALFLLENPNSPYRGQAEDQIFILATQSDELVDYLLFIRKYPNNPHIPEAWYEVYKARTEVMTVENLMDFKLDFPMYPQIETTLKEIDLIQQMLIPAIEYGRWGFIDITGKWVIQAQFDFCEPFEEGMAIYEADNSFGFINLHAEKIIEAKFEEAFDFNQGIAVVFDGAYYGAINRFGVVKIAFEFDDIGEFINGIAYAKKNGKYGYIDLNGRVLVPFQYQQAFTMNNNRALAKRYGKYGIIDKDNQIVQRFDFDWIEPDFSDTLIKVKSGDKFGLFTLTGDTVLPIQYENIGRIDNDPIMVVENGKVGYYSRSDNWLIPPKYESDPFVLDWGEFKDGLVRIRFRGKMGVIDTADTRIVPVIFEDMGRFEGELYPVKKHAKWGYADQNIKLKIPYRYQIAMPFIDSLARVKSDNKWGMVNFDGETAIGFEFNKIQQFESYYILENDTAMGMVDLKGNTIFPVVFDRITPDERGFIIVIYKGKLAYFDFASRSFFWKEKAFEFVFEVIPTG